MLEFFSTTFQPEHVFRLIFAFICGLILGFERKIRHHEVGIRTLALISMVSSLLSIVSVEMAELGSTAGAGDPTRIAAGVITGIGFIGGGAILHNGLNVRGLTSAAIVFSASGIGLACGAGLYFQSTCCLIFALIILFILERVEKRFFPSEKSKIIKIKLDGKLSANFEHKLTKNGLIIYDTNVSYNTEKNTTEMSFTVKTPDNIDAVDLMNSLSKIEKLVSISISQ